MMESERERQFLDVVSSMPATNDCVRCGKSTSNSPGEFDMDSGFEVITDPETGLRRQGGHICGDCMKLAGHPVRSEP